MEGLLDLYNESEEDRIRRQRWEEQLLKDNTRKNATTSIKVVYPQHRSAAASELQQKGFVVNKDDEEKIVGVILNKAVQRQYTERDPKIKWSDENNRYEYDEDKDIVNYPSHGPRRRPSLKSSSRNYPYFSEPPSPTFIATSTSGRISRIVRPKEKKRKA